MIGKYLISVEHELWLWKNLDGSYSLSYPSIINRTTGVAVPAICDPAPDLVIRKGTLLSLEILSKNLQREMKVRTNTSS